MSRRTVSALGGTSFGGLLVALIVWWQSLTPTLVPRSWLTQAVISGVCVALGYGLGCGVGFLIARAVQSFLRHGRRGLPPATRRWAWNALGVGWLVGVLYGSVLWLGWQNDQRDLMGMPLLEAFDVVAMVSVTAAVAALLLVASRAVGTGVRALIRYSGRRLPASRGLHAWALLVVVVVVVLAGGLALRGVTALANSHYGSVNDQTEGGIQRPDSSAVSGSRESLVAWETLGRTGRYFVATATSADALEEFHGADTAVVEPVRAYVGVLSAGSLEARAELAVRELERAGAFDREVLVVWVPTGTGWMIEEAAEALEMLHHGDTAIVSIQYSYLPSLFSVVLESGLAIEAGSALFHAVEERWAELPPDERPKLLLFGKSLGTAGVEAIFAAHDAESSLGNLTARTDGALIVGAKYVNPLHSQLTRQRDPGSPAWQPVFDAGRTVRFLSRDPNPPVTGTIWPPPRVVYLQHPSDPVPFWGVEALWRSPEWMDRPRGHDVPDAARWFPVVSAVQAVGDQIFQLSPPPGFGHDYSDDYVNGWAQVLPPDGWTRADTARLEKFLAPRTTGESEP